MNGTSATAGRTALTAPIIESPTITKRLRAQYDHVVNEPIPSDLLKLLEDLAHGIPPKG